LRGGGEARPAGFLPVTLKYIQLAVLILLANPQLHAQGNYEIQVYGYDTVAPGRTSGITSRITIYSRFCTLTRVGPL
jgi:hypothetical protein